MQKLQYIKLTGLDWNCIVEIGNKVFFCITKQINTEKEWYCFASSYLKKKWHFLSYQSHHLIYTKNQNFIDFKNDIRTTCGKRYEFE